jgi:aspartate kinase
MEDLAAFATVGISRDRAIVAIVGERLKHTPGITGMAFGALRDINVEMISMGANEINLSLLVKAEEAPGALRRLHAALFEGSAS